MRPNRLRACPSAGTELQMRAQPRPATRRATATVTGAAPVARGATKGAAGFGIQYAPPNGLGAQSAVTLRPGAIHRDHPRGSEVLQGVWDREAATASRSAPDSPSTPLRYAPRGPVVSERRCNTMRAAHIQARTSARAPRYCQAATPRSELDGRRPYSARQQPVDSRPRAGDPIRRPDQSSQAGSRRGPLAHPLHIGRYRARVQALAGSSVSLVDDASRQCAAP